MVMKTRLPLKTRVYTTRFNGDGRFETTQNCGQVFGLGAECIGYINIEAWRMAWDF
jgi:hypothetical protein